MKNYLLTLLFLLGAVTARSSDNRFAGARARALSDACVSVSDVWSTFHNPAGIAGTTRGTAGFYYESRYLIEELSMAAGTIVLPAGQGNFGISFYQFGKNAYKENKAALAYALSLSRKIKAAAQFDYFSVHFPENQRAATLVTFEAGLICQLSEKLYAGAAVFNPFKTGFKTYSEKEIIAATLRIGGHYQFGDMVMVTIEAEKIFDRKTIIKSGIEFSPAKNMALRFGVSGKPVNYTAGIGYTFGKITTDIAFGYHGNLGITPAVALNFEF